MTTYAFPELDELEGKLAKARKDAADFVAEAQDDGKLDLSKVKSVAGSNTDKAAWFQENQKEQAELAKAAEPLRELKARAERDESGDDVLDSEAVDTGKRSKASFTDLFLKSAAYKQRGAHITSDISVKTLLSTTAGWAPDTPREDLVIPIAQRPVELVDLIPKFATNQGTVTWMEQTTRTNAAAETAEGGAKPEATIVYTERTSPVQKIAVTLPVTDEQLDDVPQIRSILEVDLVNMVRQRLSDQIAAGNGTPPNLRGILNVSGIQTQAKGADPTPDAVYKAMVLVMTTGQAMPDTFVTNPLDWQDVRLLRTTDGIYIWGNPSEAGPERIWGLRVVLAQGMTQNTGVVGDFGNYSRLAIRSDVTVDIGYVNDDFSKNRQTLRAEMRCALMFTRPAAFASVTGI